MPTIAATVFDVVAALPVRGCSMREVVKALPDFEHAKVTNAVHRLREMGVLKIHHHLLRNYFYVVASGATRPTDGRRRPRRLAVSTERFKSLLGRSTRSGPKENPAEAGLKAILRELVF